MSFYKTKVILRFSLKHLLLIVIACVMLFPLLWMLLMSLKTNPTSSSILKTLASDFTLQNYVDTLSSNNFGAYFRNSLIVAVCVTLGNVIFCTMVGYILARKNFAMKPVIIASILGLLIIPSHIVMIPLYRLMVAFNWINTFYALIIPWIITPFGIFLAKQFIERIPAQIEDAARIDGASEFYIFARIVFPLAKPIIVVLAIYTFINNWNAFLFPFLFTNDSNYSTLPVGLTFYLGKQSIDWGHLMAGASVAALPILLLFLVFQKHIIQGLTAGALKE